MKRFHFISGLPRSGSTLLTAIFNQNPKFSSNISDPLFGFALSIIRDTQHGVGLDAICPVEKRRELIRDLFYSYYKNDREVCFNTNRAWTAFTPLLNDLFPNFKMIVCLREVPWILDSFEQLNAKNPYTIKPIYNNQETATVHDRCTILMGETPGAPGYVRGPLINVQQSMFCNEINNICYLEYDTLVKKPKEVMKELYDFLGEEYFEHDFNNVEFHAEEYDEQARIDGLHSTRKKIEYIERRSILPLELWNTWGPFSFWRSEEFMKNQGKLLKWITGVKPMVNNVSSDRVPSISDIHTSTTQLPPVRNMFNLPNKQL